MMPNDRYHARMTSLFFCFGLAFTTIIFDLLYIQLKQHDMLRTLAQKQYQAVLTTRPERALIYDRHAIPVVLNKTALSAYIVPNKLVAHQKLNHFLQQHFPHSAQRLASMPNQSFMYIKRQLTATEKAFIEKSDCVDINYLEESARFYPYQALAPLIGITGVDNTGLLGIELGFDTHLSGTPTVYDLEKDARTHALYLKKETKSAGHAGAPLHLTIDATLQFLIYEQLVQTAQQLDAQMICVLVMDPQTGALIACTQVPTFNPNQPLHQNELELTHNYAISQTYELGSVLKIFTALAALEEGVVTPDELIDCKNSKLAYIKGRRITTWKEHGSLQLAQIIAHSNNIGIAQIAERLGPALYNHYIRLGFGGKTGIELPGEQSGFVNPPHAWSKQSIYSLSYGYELRITPLLLAQAFGLLANGGYLIKPTILHTGEKPDYSEQKPLYSPDNIALIRSILEHTTQAGTARKARIDQYTIMCKTGSANLLHNGVYDPDRTIFTCAGIVEKGAYKRVVVVCIKEVAQKHVLASAIAVPLFEQIVQKMLIHEKIIENKTI